VIVKHVCNEELAAIPTAAEDMFIIGGKGAFEQRQKEEEAKASAAAAASAENASQSQNQAHGDDDGFLVLDDVIVEGVESAGRAKRGAADALSPAADAGDSKRSKQ
jgi:hypothetical protein